MAFLTPHRTAALLVAGALAPTACGSDDEPTPAPPFVVPDGGAGGTAVTTTGGPLCPTMVPADPSCESAQEGLRCEYAVGPCLEEYTCSGGTWERVVLECTEATCAGVDTPSLDFVALLEGTDARAGAISREAAGVLVATSVDGPLSLDGSVLEASLEPSMVLSRHGSAATPTETQTVLGELAVQSLATATAADVYVAGTFTDTLSYGGTELVSIGATDFFVAQLSSDLTPGWAISFGSPAVDEVDADVAAITGGAVVAATLKAAAEVDGTPVGGQGGMRDGLLMRIDGGVVQWSQLFAGSGNDLALAVATGPGDVIATVGFADGNVDFGGGPLLTDGTQLFVTSHDAAGVHRWTTLCTTSGIWDTDVAIDDAGLVHVSGWSATPIDCGDEPIPGTDAHFVLTFDATGALVATATGSAGGVQGAPLAVDASRGRLWATVDEDPATNRHVVTARQLDASGAEVDSASFEVAGAVTLDGVAWTDGGAVVVGRLQGALCTDDEGTAADGAGFAIALPVGP